MTQELFDELYSEFLSRDLLCLRCSHESKYYTVNEDGTFSQDSKYLVSCQTSFWDKRHMMRILKENENAWQFEYKGTKRTKQLNLAHRIAFHPLPWYAHVCYRGKFVKEFKCLLHQTPLSVPHSLTCSQK